MSGTGMRAGHATRPNSVLCHQPGTERARVELSRKSLIGKARDRPDLVRQVISSGPKTKAFDPHADLVTRKLSEETAVGYSSAGVVLEVGEHVRGFDVGDRVACAGGSASHAEIVAVPGNLRARIPAGIPLQGAALTTIAAIALHGIRLAEVQVGERVAVIGCGLVGQLRIQDPAGRRRAGIALDVDGSRVEEAVSHGAFFGAVVDADVEPRVLAASRSLGMDACIITAAASTSDPLLLAASIARDRGSVVLVRDVPIQAPRAPFYDKELRFRVSRSYGPGRYNAEYEERGLDYPIGYVRWTEGRNMEAILQSPPTARFDSTN